MSEPKRKERPILFSGAMVRAILDGRKTQTRRVLRRQPGPIPEGYTPRIYWPARDSHMALMHMDRASAQWERPGEYDGANVLGSACGFSCPYGQPGDRLWVRETFCQKWCDQRGYLDEYLYRATEPDVVHPDGQDKSPWRPSIHMPRAASRITLEITDVRVERLNDCSERDAVAEGLHILPASGRYVVNPGEQYFGAADHDPRVVYADLWDRINGAGAWEANPWVWVVEFKRL